MGDEGADEEMWGEQGDDGMGEGRGGDVGEGGDEVG